MTILLVGGGSGGHTTPLLAVAHELKKRDKSVRVIAVTDKANKFARLLEESRDIDRTVKVSAGKYRRYGNKKENRSLERYLLNIRDAFRAIAGTIQSFFLLGIHHPDVIFIKGGFVGVPVGLAARAKRIPFITHDSDAEPGLANRIIGRWATTHAVGMPAELYAYPKDKTVYVGIPLAEVYKNVTSKLKMAYRQEIKVPETAKLVFITGGSQGAQKLNQAVGKNIESLLKNSSTYVIHQTGVHIAGLPKASKRYIPKSYINSMHVYTGAADVVVTRAGSSIAELAAQGKAIIAVPAPHLAGGHQVKNGEYLVSHDAAIVLDDDQLKAHPKKLGSAIEELLNSKPKRAKFSSNLQQIYKSGAADVIAELLIKQARITKP